MTCWKCGGSGEVAWFTLKGAHVFDCPVCATVTHEGARLADKLLAETMKRIQAERRGRQAAMYYRLLARMQSRFDRIFHRR